MAIFPEQIPTASEWASWLKEAGRKLREVYLLSPDRLIAEYRREREITRGYHGREILELLQNAGDAAGEGGGKVRIVLNSHGVVVANTGRPFDIGGVRSLQTANLSPKRQRQKTVIGDKGLGFRSILNWTDSPLIMSGDLGLAFLPEYAERVLNELQTASPELADSVAKEQEHASGLIVTKLGFPQIISDWKYHDWGHCGGIRLIAEQCLELRDEGFDSAVGMPFAFPEAHEEALRQIAELSPEILIFVDSIHSLEIETSGRENRKTWSRSETNGWLSVLENERPLGVWQVFTHEDTVPEAHVDQEEAAQNAFRITIAVPKDDHSSSHRLFCYFPTDVELPLPVICHATLRLDETRKHLTETLANRYILDQLAEQLAEVAEGWADDGSSTDLWAACRLVVPNGAWGNELKKFSFPERLNESAAKRQIIPVLDETRRTPKKVKMAPGSSSDWLPARHFAEVAKVEIEEHRRICRYLQANEIQADDIIARFIAASDLTLEERATAVVGLLTTSRPPADGWSAEILCDETCEFIPHGYQAILQPTGTMPALPEWARIRFLHREMRERIGTLLQTADNRELQQKLKAFGVIEYSLAALIIPVLAESNRILRNNPDREPEVRGEVLAFLLQVYRALFNQGQLAAFPSDARLMLPSQAGSYAAPSELYLGDGFGIEGAITQDLYGAWAKEKLITKPDALTLDGTYDEVVNFLRWMGVARWPREVDAKEVDHAFQNFVINGLHYPVHFDDREFSEPDELPYVLISNVKSLDGLNELLDSSPPEAILAWMLKDDRAPGWSNKSEQNGDLSVHPKYCQNRRYWAGSIPNYIFWLVSTTAWLPCTSGVLIAPSRCLLGERLIENLFPRPVEPSEEMRTLYGIHSHLWQAFQRVGVMLSLTHFERDEIYRLLLELEQSAPDGKASKALCRWLLQHDTDLFGFPGEHQKRFFRDGKMWGVRGDASGYYPLSELRHVDADGFPAGLLRELSVVDLPKRIGAEKVEKLFNVKGVERAGISQELISHRPSPSSALHADYFERAKPYLARLRQSRTTQTQYLNALKRLKLSLCDEVKIRLVYEEMTFEYTAEYWEWFLFDDTLLVRCEIEDAPDLLADAIGAAIASVFRVGDGDAFAKMFRCDAGSRRRLLKKMCGDDFQTEIDDAERAHLQNNVYAGPISRPAGRENPANGEVEPPNGTSNPVPPSQLNAQENETEESSGSSIRQLDHTPLPGNARRRLIIRKIELRPPNAVAPRQIVDGELCERKALEFEENDNPPRFPLMVGHITGYDAPGCDLLSFATAEDRDAFKNPSTRKVESVNRFIEVKGRSSTTAKIELRGNELEAARKYHERYFLYRLYEGDGRVFLISILQDPLADQGAISPAVYVDLEQALGTKRFEFTFNDSTDSERVATLPPDGLDPRDDCDTATPLLNT